MSDSATPTPDPAAAPTADPESLVLDAFGGRPHVPLETLMDGFVALHKNGHRQRTAGWLAMKAGSIGGSEIAALMGHNPYSSFDDVVGSKVGARTFEGNTACRWGTLFESAIERFVETDCGTRLAGTDISVPAPGHSGLAGRHANSPDGYGVVTLYAAEGSEGEPEWRLLSTSAETRARAAGRRTKRVIALFEFKCPYRRQPKGGVPRHYKPQIWSGLALSPVAHLGIFVDAAFRKCALWSLGPGTGYDRTYHLEARVDRWTTPVAWGITGVYAPRLDAPRLDAPKSGAADDDMGGGAPGAPDAAYAAWRLHGQNFGIPCRSPAEEARAGRPFAPDPIDFGDCEKDVFETMLLHLDGGGFRATHQGPCFPDGRGAPLLTGVAIGAAVDRLAADAPAHHYLLGVLPWKMFEVDYAFVERREGFLAEVGPLVHDCLDVAGRLQKEKDPKRAYYKYLDEKRREKPRRGGEPAQLQDLFDLL